MITEIVQRLMIRASGISTNNRMYSMLKYNYLLSKFHTQKMNLRLQLRVFALLLLPLISPQMQTESKPPN